MGKPAARILDPTLHPLPGMLTPGPGSFNVHIGMRPAWRGIPAAAAAGLQAAKNTSEATIKAAEATTMAAAGTPGAPAALAAEQATKAAALAAMSSAISSAAGAAGAASGGIVDTHICATPLPPHGPGVVIDGSPTVLINGLPACRMGDTLLEALGPPNKIAMGEFRVHIGGASSSGGGAGGGGGGGGGGGFLDSVGALVSQIGEAISDAVEAASEVLNPDVTTGLGADVDAIVNQSPTLKAKLNQLISDGWTIEPREGGGTEADREAQVIRVDTKDKSNEDLVTSLAHEAGHATYEMDPYVPIEGNTRDEYVEGNLQRSLRDEGEATLTNVEVRDEILENGGPEIPIAGNPANHAQYEQAYDDYQTSGDRDAARDEIGGIFADGERTSTGSKPTYREYYGGFYEDYYDNNASP